ncbi:hypothetical protein [Lacticaseibacillus camelliae]|uniref:Uncharacterized protein n=1 Tax=Lacticaseibacillus camelliae DSM 22697 = JCM 13995 TaxID=1423730 RepID=A0A0R2FDM0_9LACO|nr:hypothetical protein [Lacticaseibacillus camelliae]KRN23084.1 hypothetical protein FC75_GL001725 [Lacticaseibacillus camelliae DSM 22697 = JCM 13995]
MKGQVILELKKQPWLLHLFWLIMLVAVMGTLGVGWENHLQRHGVGYPETGFKTDWDKATTAGEAAWNMRYLEHDIKADTKAAAKLPAVQQGDNKAQALMETMLADYQKRDYRHLNQAILKAAQEDPQAVKSIEELNYLSPNTDELIALMRYMVKHLPNRLIQVDAMTSVTGNFAAIFGLQNYFSASNGKDAEVLTALLLIMGLTLFCYVYFQDRRLTTDTMMRTAPVSGMKQALIRGGVTLGLINLILLIAVVSTLLAMSLLPGHEFGTWLQPLVYTLNSHVGTTSLAQALGQEWLMINLWWLVFAGLAFCLSLVSRNLLVGMLVLAVVAFANRLQLLGLIDPALRTYVPSAHTVFPNLILHSGSYGEVAFGTVVVTFVAWILALFICGGLIQMARQRLRFAAAR